MEKEFIEFIRTGIDVRGIAETRQVYIDGEPLKPERSQAIRNHSPDGFSWGYAGSGPAQLALAIMLEILDDESIVTDNYQEFKRQIISHLPMDRDFHVVISTYKCDGRLQIIIVNKYFMNNKIFHVSLSPLNRAKLNSVK